MKKKIDLSKELSFSILNKKHEDLAKKFDGLLECTIIGHWFEFDCWFEEWHEGFMRVGDTVMIRKECCRCGQGVIKRANFFMRRAIKKYKLKERGKLCPTT